MDVGECTGRLYTGLTLTYRLARCLCGSWASCFAQFSVWLRTANKAGYTCQFLSREQLCYRGISCRNSVRPSVRPTVCHTRALWQNQTMHCGYFDTTRKSNHSSFLLPQWLVGDGPSICNLRSK